MVDITRQEIKTTQEIESLKYNELIRYAVSINIKYQRQSKDVLLQMVLDRVEQLIEAEALVQAEHDEETFKREGGQVSEIKIEVEKPKSVEPKKRVVDVHVTESQKLILENDNISKSEKMRRLYRRGMTIADIHRVLESHYSFTYGVIDRYRKMIAKDN